VLKIVQIDKGDGCGASKTLGKVENGAGGGGTNARRFKMPVRPSRRAMRRSASSRLLTAESSQAVTIKKRNRTPAFQSGMKGRL
jgi:hypothetical protein